MLLLFFRTNIFHKNKIRKRDHQKVKSNTQNKKNTYILSKTANTTHFLFNIEAIQYQA